jgi:hypothetical protein
MQVRRVRVQIETERLRIVGTLQLPTEGYRSRTTDFLNAHETGFIALTDAEVSLADGSGEATEREFVAVGCRHIAALAELEDLGVTSDEDPPAVAVPPTLDSTSAPPPSS